VGIYERTGLSTKMEKVIHCPVSSGCCNPGKNKAKEMMAKTPFTQPHDKYGA